MNEVASAGRPYHLATAAPDEIPASHRDLAECPPVAALTTVAPDGYPQTSVVCYDPRRPLRYLEVRGVVVEMTEAGAAEHLDRLASKYAGRPVRFFGDAIPASFAQTEIPVLCRIRPTHVVAPDATVERRSS